MADNCKLKYKGEYYDTLNDIKKAYSRDHRLSTLQSIRSNIVSRIIDQKNLQGFNMGDIINHTGGAYGADTYFDLIGNEFGVTDHRHYRPKGMNSVSAQLRNKQTKGVEATEAQMKEGYELIDKIYKKKHKVGVPNDFKARNSLQVLNSDRVIGIAKLNPNKTSVMGGTGAAFEMAKYFKKDAFVFDLNSQKWYMQRGNYFVESEVPVLTKNFAGVGSREIEKYNTGTYVNGKYVSKGQAKYIGDTSANVAYQAIRDVYKKTKAIVDRNPKIDSPLKGIVIVDSNQKGLGYALTNPTHTSPRGYSWTKGDAATRKYLSGNKIAFNGKKYRDVEEAYQENKIKENTENTKDSHNYNLMVSLMVEKLKIFPKLVSGIDNLGGINYLNRIHHAPSNKSSVWHSGDINRGNRDWFKLALIEAYHITKNTNNLTGASVFEKLPKKVQSKNVILPSDYKNFNNVSGFNKSIPFFKSEHNGIIAFRLQNDLNLKENFEKNNAIGNPFPWKGRPAGSATIDFIDWILGNRFHDVEPEYRNAITSAIKDGSLQDQKILYYTDIIQSHRNRPSHATALDYLINEINIPQFQSDLKSDKSYYEGEIVNDGGTVFVYGANPEARHGAGAARSAKEDFGVLNLEKYHSQFAHGLITKDLASRVPKEKFHKNDKDEYFYYGAIGQSIKYFKDRIEYTRDGKTKIYLKYSKSGMMKDTSIGVEWNEKIPADFIRDQVKSMYEKAAANKNMKYKVAYRELHKKSLNGYTGMDMVKIFNAAGIPPSNVVFHKNLHELIKRTEDTYTSSGVVKVEGGQVVVKQDIFDNDTVKGIKDELVTAFNDKLKYNFSNLNDTKKQTAISYGPVNYKYSGGNGREANHPSQEMPEWLYDLARDFEKKMGKPEGYYNHSLINRYGDNQGIGSHKDNESIYQENGKSGAVLVYSIGKTKNEHVIGKEKFKANHNSIIEMSNGDIFHSVAKSDGTRYSINFRHIPDSNLTPDYEVIDNNFIYRNKKFSVKLINNVPVEITSAHFPLVIELEMLNAYKDNLSDNLSRMQKEVEERENKSKLGFTYKGISIDTDFVLGQEQVMALEAAIDHINNPLKSHLTIQGSAGTGKTTIAGLLNKYMNANPRVNKRFTYMSPTHTANVQLALANLAYGIDKLPLTLTSSFVYDGAAMDGSYKISNKANNPRSYGDSVFIIDEASMISPEDVTRILELTEIAEIPVIFLGDPIQLPGIDNSSEHSQLTEVFNPSNTVILNKVYRQNPNDLLKMLTEIKRNKTFKTYFVENHDDSLSFNTEQDFIDKATVDFLFHKEDTKIITPYNKKVKMYNLKIKERITGSKFVTSGDLLVGGSGKMNKSPEKNSIANSISYTIQSIKPVSLGDGSKRLEITSKSDILTKISAKIAGVHSTVDTLYYPLSSNDSLQHESFDAKSFDKNNESFSHLFKGAAKDYLKNKHDWIKQERIKQDFNSFFERIDFGGAYYYSQKANKLLPKNESAMRAEYGKQKKDFFDLISIDKGVDYGYAVTVHKSQGMTIKNTYVDVKSMNNAPDFWSKRNVLDTNGNKVNEFLNNMYYVALSRASKRANINMTSGYSVKVDFGKNPAPVIDLDAEVQKKMNDLNDKNC